MTVDELLARESIRNLMAIYNTAGDSLRKDEFASVFTEDAELLTGNLSFKGKDAIREGIFSSVSETRSNPRQPEFVRHNLTTSKITFIDNDTAKGRTYFQVNTDIGLDHCGIYLDEFCREGEEWKIARRKVRTEYMAENSYFK